MKTFFQQSATEFELICEMDVDVNLNDITSGNADEYDFTST